MENPFKPKQVEARILTEFTPFEMFMAKVAGNECQAISGPFQIRGYYYKGCVYPTHLLRKEVISPPPSQH